MSQGANKNSKQIKFLKRLKTYVTKLRQAGGIEDVSGIYARA